MEVIFHKVLPDPPYKYVNERKRIKINSKGEIVGDTIVYLTLNMFYGAEIHWSLRNKVVKWCKEWLLPYISDIPKLEKCKIKIIYHHNKDTWDLDNKAFFWNKILQDILKTPTSKQEAKALEYENEIITINSIPDDTVRFINDIHVKYKVGSPALEIKIKGRKAAIQGTLF